MLNTNTAPVAATPQAVDNDIDAALSWLQLDHSVLYMSVCGAVFDALAEWSISVFELQQGSAASECLASSVVTVATDCTINLWFLRYNAGDIIQQCHIAGALCVPINRISYTHVPDMPAEYSITFALCAVFSFVWFSLIGLLSDVRSTR